MSLCTPEQAAKNREAMSKMTAEQWQHEFNHRVEQEIRIRNDQAFLYPHDVADALQVLRNRIARTSSFDSFQRKPFKLIILAALDMAIANVELSGRT